jgi:hypothetical protein
MLRSLLAAATVLLYLGWSGAAVAASLDAISNRDAIAGLKEALIKGSDSAVSSLGRRNGFFDNPRVKIPLPESLRRAEGLMRTLGMGKYADELVLTMNRAAEQAVPEAKTLLIDAVKKMTVSDAKAILTGGDDSATQYFRRKTSAQLHDRFLPIVKKETARLGLAEKYNQYAGEAAHFGLVSKQDANLDEYVTAKALDGLFLMIAQEEKQIRKDPLAAGSSIISKVFGALR